MKVTSLRYNYHRRSEIELQAMSVLLTVRKILNILTHFFGALLSPQVRKKIASSALFAYNLPQGYM